MSPEFILSVISSICLIISEILPFIKRYDSNGLLQLLLNISKTIVKDKDNERLPLLNESNESNENNDNESINTNNYIISNTDNDNVNVNVDVKNNLKDKLDVLNSNINNMTNTLNCYVTEAQNARQLKLQPMEFYELNYIINFIKVNYNKKMYQTKFLSKSNKQLLISQGYIIDYDYQNDIHTVKW